MEMVKIVGCGPAHVDGASIRSQPRQIRIEAESERVRHRVAESLRPAAGSSELWYSCWMRFRSQQLST